MDLMQIIEYLVRFEWKDLPCGGDPSPDSNSSKSDGVGFREDLSYTLNKLINRSVLMEVESSGRHRSTGRRNRVTVGANDVTARDPTVSHIIDFKKPPAIDLASVTDDTVTFNVRGSTPAFVNAIRRTIMSDVETMAIELVSIAVNTSVIYDEHLAMRVGLIPLNIDPQLFARYPETLTENPAFDPTDADPSAAVAFTLDVSAPLDGDVVIVRSGDLRHLPLGDQLASGPLVGLPEPRPVHDDIVIAKLKPGQRIAFTALAIRGNGFDHAKWQPALAFYRMQAHVSVLQSPPVADPKAAAKRSSSASRSPAAAAGARAFAAKGGPVTAEAIRDTCPTGVFDIEDGALVVAHPDKCTICRACVEQFPTHVAVELQRDDVAFTVETQGQLPPVVVASRVRTIVSPPSPHHPIMPSNFTQRRTWLRVVGHALRHHSRLASSLSSRVPRILYTPAHAHTLPRAPHHRRHSITSQTASSQQLPRSSPPPSLSSPTARSVANIPCVALYHLYFDVCCGAVMGATTPYSAPCVALYHVSERDVSYQTIGTLCETNGAIPTKASAVYSALPPFTVNSSFARAAGCIAITGSLYGFMRTS